VKNLPWVERYYNQSDIVVLDWLLFDTTNIKGAFRLLLRTAEEEREQIRNQ
jgi:hypothetical protein